MNKPTPENLGKLLSLIVHDLRNPTAALSANTSFIADVLGSGPSDEIAPEDLNEVREATGDSATALADLTRGLDQVGYIARWLSNVPIVKTAASDLIAQLRLMASQPRSIPVEVDLPAHPSAIRVKGGEGLPKLLEVLIANAIQHGSQGKIRLSARRQNHVAIVELRDDAVPLAPELRNQAFTLEGQVLLKERANGRYSRVAGLFAAGIVAEAIGAQLEADDDGGSAVFRITLQLEP
jgi:signal transduction histidine kinase